MIIFIDLSNNYWPEADPCKPGPFAFLDTVTDKFLDLVGSDNHVWFNMKELQDAWTDSGKSLSDRDFIRLSNLVPTRFWGGR